MKKQAEFGNANRHQTFMKYPVVHSMAKELT